MTQPAAADHETEVLQAAAYLQRRLADHERHHWKNDVAAGFAEERGLPVAHAGFCCFEAARLIPDRLAWTGPKGSRSVRLVRPPDAEPAEPAEAVGAPVVHRGEDREDRMTVTSRPVTKGDTREPSLECPDCRERRRFLVGPRPDSPDHNKAITR